MYYDRSKPFTKQVKFFNVFNPSNFIEAPAAYIIPQGWYGVIDLLKLIMLQMQQFKNDTLIDVDAYHIDDYKALPRPYEKHHKNSAVKVINDESKNKIFKRRLYYLAESTCQPVFGGNAGTNRRRQFFCLEFL